LDSDGTGPKFCFPWPDEFKPNGDKAAVHVLKGDHLYVHETRLVETGTALDQKADQAQMSVIYAIRRGDSVRVVETPATFTKERSLTARDLIDHRVAEDRIEKLLGTFSKRSEFSMIRRFRQSRSATEVRDANRARDYAERAFYALCMTRSFRKLVQLTSKAADFEPSTLNTPVLALQTAAISAGYWLGKSEFAAHIDDAFVGKRRRDASRKSGRKSADKNIRNAETGWRSDALVLAHQQREKHPSWGQKRLASYLLETLTDIGKKPPDLDTIIRTIRRWEVDGEIPRSAAYRRGGER
jgi:hypothetical protein